MRVLHRVKALPAAAAQSAFGLLAVGILVLGGLGPCAGLAPAHPAPQAQPASPSQPKPPAAAPPAQPAVQAQSAAPAAAAPLSTAAATRKAWHTLNEGLEEKNYDRRAQVVVALGTIGLRKDAVTPVEAALMDKNPAVRQAAVEVLGNLKSRSSIPRLQGVLDDKSAVVSFAAARALWNMGDRSGEDLFLEIVDGDRKISTNMIQQGLKTAHEDLHDPKALAELGAEQTAGAFFGPAGFGVKAALDLAKDKAAPARATSALMLADDPGEGAREALRAALMDKTWIVRAAAAEALGKHGSAADVGVLSPLLDDPQKEVRYRAAAAIIRVTSTTSSRPPA